MNYFFNFLMLPGIFFLAGLAIASIAWIGVVTKAKSEQKRWQVIADANSEKIDETSTGNRICKMELEELQKAYNTVKQKVKLQDMEIEDLQKQLKFKEIWYLSGKPPIQFIEFFNRIGTLRPLIDQY